MSVRLPKRAADEQTHGSTPKNCSFQGSSNASKLVNRVRPQPSRSPRGPDPLVVLSPIGIGLTDKGVEECLQVGHGGVTAGRGYAVVGKGSVHAFSWPARLGDISRRLVGRLSSNINVKGLEELPGPGSSGIGTDGCEPPVTERVSVPFPILSALQLTDALAIEVIKSARVPRCALAPLTIRLEIIHALSKIDVKRRAGVTRADRQVLVEIERFDGRVGGLDVGFDGLDRCEGCRRGHVGRGRDGVQNVFVSDRDLPRRRRVRLVTPQRLHKTYARDVLGAVGLEHIFDGGELVTEGLRVGVDIWTRGSRTSILQATLHSTAHSQMAMATSMSTPRSWMA